MAARSAVDSEYCLVVLMASMKAVEMVVSSVGRLVALMAVRTADSMVGWTAGWTALWSADNWGQPSAVYSAAR